MESLIKILEEFSDYQLATQLLVLFLLFSFVIGCVIICFLVYRLTKPISKKGFRFKAGDTEIDFKISGEGTPLEAEFEYRFQADFFESRQRELINNIRQLRHIDYRERLDWETDFLNRIISLSKSADYIYAITRTSVSHFWTKEKQVDGVVAEYLNSQPNKGTKRLFVVGNTAELQEYEQVFIEHYRNYGKGGRVLLTNQQSYLKLLDHICNDKALTTRLFNSDFGLWGFRNNLTVYAELRPPELEFRDTTNLINPPPIDPKKLEDIMDEDFVGLVSEAENGRFYRWVEGSNLDIAREVLFPKDTHTVGMVRHLVLMKHKDSTVLEEISSRVVDLNKIAEEEIRLGNPLRFKQSYAWWGERVSDFINKQEPFLDGVYGGKLEIDTTYSHLMMLELPSIAELRKYYKNRSHSEVRKNVYTKLIESLGDIYRELEKLNGDEKISQFETLEKIVQESGCLKRMDFAEIYRH